MISTFIQNIKLFILGILIQHGATCHIWIFNVQCSFSMGYLTSTIYFNPKANPIFIPTTKRKMNGYIQSFLNPN